MSNPQHLVVAGFATEGQALALWSQLLDNDHYVVCEVNLGFSTGKPAEKPVCWLVLPLLSTGELGIRRGSVDNVAAGIGYPQAAAEIPPAGTSPPISGPQPVDKQ